MTLQHTSILRLFTACLFLFTGGHVAAQSAIRSFLDPVVQKEVIDVAVNNKQKRMATLEISGAMHVYDLSQRRPLFFTKHNEEEISEGGTHQSGSRRLIRFNESGDLLGFFNKQNGFVLYHATTGDTLLELAWKGAGAQTISQSPLPFDLKFMGNYLLLQYSSENDNADKMYDNNSFLIDIKNGRLVNIFGKEGFNCNDDFLENADTVKEISVYAQRPRDIFPVNIYWKKKPIRLSKALKTKEPLLISDQGIKNQTEVLPADEEDDETEDPAQLLQQLKTAATEDSASHKRLRAAIKQNSDWRTLFGSMDKPAEMYAAIDSLDFLLSAADRISRYELRKYSIEYSYYNIIEVWSNDQPVQYFLEQKQSGAFRFKNAYFVNTVRKTSSRSNPDNYWQLLWPGENGMYELASFPDQKGFNLLSCLVSSASGNKIAWVSNEGRSALIHGLNLETGKEKMILKIPSVKANDWWIRNDDIATGNFRQLNVYRFVDDDYFFVQGIKTGLNNLFFETTYWSKILEQPLAGNEYTGSRSEPTRNLFSSNGKILLDNEKTWTYNSNLFEPVAFRQNSDNYDYDYDNINITDYKTLNQHFLKKIQLKYDNGKILINDGAQFIETNKDENNRIKWAHHAGQLKLEYYPHLSMLDLGNENMDEVKKADPNYYADAELSADIRLTAGNGKKIILRSPFGASRGYFKAAFSDDKEFVFSLSGHNYVDIWRSFDGSYLATIMPYGSSDFLVIDKDHYYYTTNPGSLRNLYMQANGKIYPAGELDIFQNRPDTILQSLRFIKNDQLLSFYKEWVTKRQAAAGMMEPDHSKRPKIDINTNTVALATDRPELVFNITTSHGSQLDKAYLLMNHVLTDSLQLSSAAYNQQFKTVLQAGSNKIQVWVKDKTGLQSLKETFYINYEPAVTRNSSITGVAMGVSTYQNEKYNLEYASKDAKDLSEKITALHKGTIQQLLNEKASAQNLHSSGKHLQQLQPDDIAIVYLAGHGALDKKGNFYFCTSQTDLSSPERNGISMQELQSFFSRLKARRRLLILDACHSGNTGLAQQSPDSSDQPASLKGRGNIVIKKQQSTTGNISSRNYAEILKQQLYDAGNSNGVHVFSATSGAGLAYESDAWQNGVFTMMLMKGLENNEADTDKNRQVDLAELVLYVSEEVRSATRGLQAPESTLIKWDNNWVLIE